jgi:hypothetical protein
MNNKRRRGRKPRSRDTHKSVAESEKRREQASADLEALLRKGLFLRRMFARPHGPLVDENGDPTSLALSVRRYGEAIPKTAADAARLAKKGSAILDQYHAAKADLQLDTAA